jgi:hypothetical protein
MFKAKIWGVAAAMMIVAFGAMASNFRVADQVYLPIAGHVSNLTTTFVSDVFISNLSPDAVQISIIYGRQNNTGAFQSFANKITLAANERKEFIDFFPTVLPEIANPFGLLVFNACKSGADCTPDPVSGENPNFRQISVESRIYAIDLGANPATAKSNGQDMPGIPWYNFVSSTENAAGLGKVFITGLRNNTGYRSNLGVVNASQFSTTQIIATLRDGLTGNPVGNQKVYTLAPLSFEQANIAGLFGSTGSGTNLYIDLEQGPSTKTTDADANGCPDGCPAYLAYGSVLDQQSSDPTTQEAQYKQQLTATQIACIYNPAEATCALKVGAKTLHRAVKH